jgi:hypothetical protein
MRNHFLSAVLLKETACTQATDRKALFLKETAHKAPSHRQEGAVHMNAMSDVMGCLLLELHCVYTKLIGKQSNVIDTTQIMCVCQFHNSSELLSLDMPVH